MAHGVSLHEFWRQLVQRSLCSYWFNAPGLLRMRIWAYGLLFGAGRGCSYAHHVYFERHHGLRGGLVIGDHVQIAHDVTIDCSGGVVLEDHAWISEGAIIITHEHIIIADGLKVDATRVEVFPVSIGRDAWVGARALILPQARSVGEGAFIGAGAVVTKPVAPFDIVAGNPAKVIGNRRDKAALSATHA